MEAKDLLIAPLVLLFVYLIAFWIRPRVTDKVNRKYFIPALSLKIAGGICLGLIYQFYYGGGDTFTYFTYGSKYIWEAFLDSPFTGLKLVFAGKDYAPDTFSYASKIYTYGDKASYFVVRVAGVLDLFTFHSYTGTSILFSTLSFTGIWVLFLTFYKLYPVLHRYFAIALFFVPSLFFWGSGILKDPLTLAALGWATFSCYKIFFEKKQVWVYVICLLVAMYVLYTVKIYIIICFMPAALIWIFYGQLGKIKNIVLRIMVAPLIIAAAAVAGYYSIVKIGENSPRYSIENMINTAEVTAEWIHYVSVREGGSAYTLGDFDYSPTGIIRKFPLAVWVTLYRPYLWESNNIVMALSALESLAMLLFTLFVIYRAGVFRFFRLIIQKPVLLFCFVFTIGFSFAVGISTYNFGSLVRYKIPMIPFFLCGLVIVWYYSKLEKKRPMPALTEN